MSAHRAKQRIDLLEIPRVVGARQPVELAPAAAEVRDDAAVAAAEASWPATLDCSAAFCSAGLPQAASARTDIAAAA